METKPSEQFKEVMKGLGKEPKAVKFTFLNIPLDKKEFMERIKRPWRFLRK